jgi:hypothetical protein
MKSWKVKKIWRKSAQGMSGQKVLNVSNTMPWKILAGKIQFMIRSGALIPWAHSPPTHVYHLDF